jgi:hypothetical protein
MDSPAGETGTLRSIVVPLFALDYTQVHSEPLFKTRGTGLRYRTIVGGPTLFEIGEEKKIKNKTHPHSEINVPRAIPGHEGDRGSRTGKWINQPGKNK